MYATSKRPAAPAPAPARARARASAALPGLCFTLSWSTRCTPLPESRTQSSSFSAFLLGMPVHFLVFFSTIQFFSTFPSFICSLFSPMARCLGFPAFQIKYPLHSRKNPWEKKLGPKTGREICHHFLGISLFMQIYSVHVSSALKQTEIWDCQISRESYKKRIRNSWIKYVQPVDCP